MKIYVRLLQYFQQPQHKHILQFHENKFKFAYFLKLKDTNQVSVLRAILFLDSISSLVP